MRVRFVSTFEPATSFYRDLLPSLVAAGHDVELVVSGAEYREGRDSLGALRADGVVVTRVPSPVASPRGAVQKLAVMVAFVTGTMARTGVGRSADLNVFFSTPPFFAAWGMVLRLVRRQPYVCVVQDVYPDVLILDEKLRAGGAPGRALHRLSRLTWRRAAGVVVIGRCMAELVAAGGVPPERIHLIRNWGHSAVGRGVAPRDSELRHELKAGDKFVVLYSGNLGLSHSFDEILEAARRLRRSHPEVLFVFIGAGRRRREVEDAKQRDGLDNIVLLPFQPADRLAQTLSAGDVHFISLRTGFEGVVVPSKAYSALAAGRPLVYLGRVTGEIARTIDEHAVGTVVAPGDVDGLVGAIVGYAGDPSRTSAASDRAAELVRGELSAERSLAAWDTLLRSLCVR